MIVTHVFTVLVVHHACSVEMQRRLMKAIAALHVVLTCVLVTVFYVGFHIISNEEHFEKSTV
jgi:hypothetical protein